MLWYKWFVELIGFWGLAFVALSTRSKKRTTMAWCSFLGYMIFAAEYYLLGSTCGAGLEIIYATTVLLFSLVFKVDKRKNNKILLLGIALISVLFMATGYLLWEGVLSAVVVMAKILAILSYLFFDPHKARLITLPSCIMSLIFTSEIVSIAGSILYGAIIIYIVVMELRFAVESTTKKKSSSK